MKLYIEKQGIVYNLVTAWNQNGNSLVQGCDNFKQLNGKLMHSLWMACIDLVSGVSFVQIK